MQAGVRARLAESGIDPHSVDGLEGVFCDVTDPFQGIETCHLQEKYFREKVRLTVSLFVNTVHCYVFPNTSLKVHV